MTYYEICYNARKVGMIDDLRVNFDTPVDGCKGFKMRKELTTPKQPGSPAFPTVCGNCQHYSVQG